MLRRRVVMIGLLAAVVGASCTRDGNEGSTVGDADALATSVTLARAARSSLDQAADAVQRDVKVSFAYGPPDRPWVIDATPGAAGEGLLLHGTTGYTGDWTATGLYAYVTASQGSEFGALSLGVLDGEVKGCGSGRFVLLVASVSGTPHGWWQIIDGLGTADLESLAGSGEWETLEGEVGGSTSAGTIRGRVDCSGGTTSSEASRLYGTKAGGRVRVDARAVADGPATVWKQDVGPSGGSEADARVLSDGFATVSLDGSWVGQATARIAAVAGRGAAGGSAEVMVMRFDGTVAGCGAGSLVAVTVDRAGAAGGSRTRSFSWEVVPGLGTGALEGATGFGEGSGNSRGDAGTFTGSMSCSA